MYIKIEDHEKQTTRIIDYPGDMSMFLWAHKFGMFDAVKIRRDVYALTDRITGEIFRTVSKPGKREVAAYERGKIENGN